MDGGQHRDLLHLLKTLADEHRLTMIGLMKGRERTVSEMAEFLRLSEPTVSHHVSKLHSARLLRLRMAGNQRFYSLNQARLAVFKAYAVEIDSLPTEAQPAASDNAWIDALAGDPLRARRALHRETSQCDPDGSPRGLRRPATVSGGLRLYAARTWRRRLLAYAGR